MNKLYTILQIITILLLLYLAPLHAQCDFEIDTYDKFDNMVTVETKQERVFYKLNRDAVKLSAGNQGTNYYYVAFTIFRTPPWQLQFSDNIKLMLDNGTKLLLSPETDFHSESYYEPMGAYYRETGTIKCPISYNDLEVLANASIKELSIPAVGMGDLGIKKKNGKKHQELVQCLIKRVKELKKKYPDMNKQAIVRTPEQPSSYEVQSNVVENIEDALDKHIYIAEECEIKVGDRVEDFNYERTVFDTIYIEYMYKPAGYEDAVYDTLGSQLREKDAYSTARIIRPEFNMVQKTVRLPNGKGEMVIDYQEVIKQGKFQSADIPARYNTFDSLVLIDIGSQGSLQPEVYKKRMYQKRIKDPVKTDNSYVPHETIQCPSTWLSINNYDKKPLTLKKGSKLFVDDSLNDFVQLESDQSCKIILPEIINEQFLKVKTDSNKEGLVDINSIKELINLKETTYRMYAEEKKIDRNTDLPIAVKEKSIKEDNKEPSLGDHIYITEECEIVVGDRVQDYNIEPTEFEAVYTKYMYKPGGYEDAVYDTLRRQYLMQDASFRTEKTEPELKTIQKRMELPNGKGAIEVNYQKVVRKGKFRRIDHPARYGSFDSLVLINVGSKGDFQAPIYKERKCRKVIKQAIDRENSYVPHNTIQCPSEQLSIRNYDKQSFTLKQGSKLFRDDSFKDFEQIASDQPCKIVMPEIIKNQFLNVKTESNKEGLVDISSIKELINVKGTEFKMYKN